MLHVPCVRRLLICGFACNDASPVEALETAPKLDRREADPSEFDAVFLGCIRRIGVKPYGLILGRPRSIGRRRFRSRRSEGAIIQGA
jgi:hypothetical protein